MVVDPEDHIGLLHYCARRLVSPTDERYDEALQHGAVALMYACRHFDPARGTQFSTYAVLSIQRAIIRGWKKSQPFIAVPENWAMRDRIPVRSLNAPARGADGDPVELGDVLPSSAPCPTAAAECNETRDRVRAAIATLPARDRLVLSLRYGIRDGADGAGEALTLQEVAKVLRVTRERVRQIQERPESRLRRRLAG